MTDEHIVYVPVMPCMHISKILTATKSYSKFRTQQRSCPVQQQCVLESQLVSSQHDEALDNTGMRSQGLNWINPVSLIGRYVISIFSRPGM